jgi:hypothetical protein
MSQVPDLATLSLALQPYTGSLIAAITTALLIIFDLDRIFYWPRSIRKRTGMLCWAFIFLVSNGILSGLFYTLFEQLDQIKDNPIWLKGMLLGIAFLTVIHLKVTSLNVRETDVPVGLDILYEGGKTFVFKRINNLSSNGRIDDASTLSNRHELGDLGSRAKRLIDRDQLLSIDQKSSDKSWLTRVINDAAANDADKKEIVADYILTRRKSDDYA